MRKKQTTNQELTATPEEEKEVKKVVRKTRTTRKKKVEDTEKVSETKKETATDNAEKASLNKEATITTTEPLTATETQSASVQQHIAEPKPAITTVSVPALPNIEIHDIIELLQAPQRAIVLTDQQIQQLTLTEVEQRHVFLEKTLTSVLDYDVVISDTNIWLELLIGHTSSHSDPRVNARLQFERQLEFISKMMKYRGGKFMIMGETYEEIDRFASMQEPQDHKDADWTDNIVCLNAAARLAKRLILSQQRENRLRIEGIGAESHHAAFADPAIVRRVVELFAEGKKVLLITNDASVAIRSMGLCDDLQRYNNISDADWNVQFVPVRPMVFTFDDLKVLDFYTRQYHYIQMASGQPWMKDVTPSLPKRSEGIHIELNIDAFRPGDKHKGDNLFPDQEKIIQKQKQQPKQKQEQQKQQPKQKPEQQTKQKPEQQPKQKPEQQTKQKPEQQTKQEQTIKQDANPETNKVMVLTGQGEKSENTASHKPRRRSQRTKKNTEITPQTAEESTKA